MSAPPVEPVTARPRRAGEHLLRELAPQVLGAVDPPLRRLRRRRGRGAGGAARRRAQWPREGVPDNPRGWLIQVAARRMTDHLRSGARAPPARRRSSCAGSRRRAGRARRRIERRSASRAATTRSILLFMCCHPALTPPSAIALTLRAVGGLTTAEIAQRVPRARGDDGAADQPRQADDQGVGRAVPHADRRASAPSG